MINSMIERTDIPELLRMTVRPDQFESVRFDLESSRHSCADTIELYRETGRAERIPAEKRRLAVVEEAMRQLDATELGHDAILTLPAWFAYSSLQMIATNAFEAMQEAFDQIGPGRLGAFTEARKAFDEWLAALLEIYEIAPNADRIEYGALPDSDGGE